MNTKLLMAIAASIEPVVLRESEDIALFTSLMEKGLVSGEFHTAMTGERFVAVHGLTPDGRALLALQACAHGGRKELGRSTRSSRNMSLQ